MRHLTTVKILLTLARLSALCRWPVLTRFTILRTTGSTDMTQHLKIAATPLIVRRDRRKKAASPLLYCRSNRKKIAALRLQRIQKAIKHYADAPEPTDRLAKRGARILARIELYLGWCWPLFDNAAKEQWLRQLVILYKCTQANWRRAVASDERHPSEKTHFSELKHEIWVRCQRYHCVPTDRSAAA